MPICASALRGVRLALLMMNRIAHYLVRLLRVAVGFLLAIAVGAAIVLLFDLNRGRIPEPLAGGVMVGFLTFQAARFMWPLLMVEFVAEAMRWRSLGFHLGVGLLGTAASLVFAWMQGSSDPPDPILGAEQAITVTKVIVAIVAGLAGGFVYWLVAGRSAGLIPLERTGS
jgi:hypothetical protein